MTHYRGRRSQARLRMMTRDGGHEASTEAVLLVDPYNFGYSNATLCEPPGSFNLAPELQCCRTLRDLQVQYYPLSIAKPKYVCLSHAAIHSFNGKWAQSRTPAHGQDGNIGHGTGFRWTVQKWITRNYFRGLIQSTGFPTPSRLASDSLLTFVRDFLSHRTAALDLHAAF